MSNSPLAAIDRNTNRPRQRIRLKTPLKRPRAYYTKNQLFGSGGSSLSQRKEAVCSHRRFRSLGIVKYELGMRFCDEVWDYFVIRKPFDDFLYENLEACLKFQFSIDCMRTLLQALERSKDLNHF
ncbi:hypothetical protein H5410_024359 [Solanum commersonii]|uniref:Uncharacterized protein n=1 Tax=Solanum commersonii TaxID=4109 RepID=A0A9J5ZLU0_SOLCO|nr:hypothetical protein H5410_024359 [Solanum commersonii]